MFEILFKSSIVSEQIMRTKWFLVNLQHHVLEVFPASLILIKEEVDRSQSLFYIVPQEKNITVKLARLSRSALGTPQVRMDHPLGQFKGCKGAKRFPLRLLRPLLLTETNCRHKARLTLEPKAITDD